MGFSVHRFACLLLIKSCMGSSQCRDQLQGLEYAGPKHSEIAKLEKHTGKYRCCRSLDRQAPSSAGGFGDESDHHPRSWPVLDRHQQTGFGPSSRSSFVLCLASCRGRGQCQCAITARVSTLSNLPAELLHALSHPSHSSSSLVAIMMKAELTWFFHCPLPCALCPMPCILYPEPCDLSASA